MPFPVTQQVTEISGVFSQPYLVHNAGTATAYLGTSSSLAPGTQALTLVPGASLNWNGSDQLWCVCAAGESTVIETLLTANGHSAPGPSSVSLDTPVAIDPNANAVSVPGGIAINAPVQLEAGSTVDVTGTVGITGDIQLAAGATVDISGPVSLAAGTAVDIAGTVNVNPVQIASGTVDIGNTPNVAISGTPTVAIQSGTVDATITGPVTIESGQVDATVYGNVGAYAANRPVFLGNQFCPFTTAAQTVLINLTPTSGDITAYASLIVNLSISASGVVPAFSSADYITLTITQYANNAVVSEYEAQWLLTGASGLLQVPVVGTSYSISGQIVKGANSYSGTLDVAVIGSSQTILEPRYISDNAGLSGGCGSGGMLFVRDFTGATRFISSRYGDAIVFGEGDTASTNSSANMYVSENGTSYIFAGTGALGSAASKSFPLKFPMRPISLVTIPVGSNGSIIVSVGQ